MAGKQSFRQIAAIAIATACLLSTVVEMTEAQRRTRRRGSSSIFYTLRDTRVVKELKLTDTQKKEIRDLSSKTRMTREQYSPFLKRIEAAKTEDEKKKFRAELSAASDKHRANIEEQAKAVLTKEQRERVSQLHYRRAGSRAILMTSAIAELKMTDDQKKKVEETIKAREEAFGRIPGRDKYASEKIGAFRQDTLKQVFTHLTPEQQGQWRKMLGEPASWEKSSTSKSSGGSKSPAKGSTQIRRPAKTVSPDTYVASFDASKQQTNGDNRPTTSYGASNGGTATKKLQNPSEKKDISFSFVNAPWKIVLEHFAKKAKLTLEAPEVPAGTLNYKDHALYTATQALDIINGRLLTQKFILVRRAKFLVVHNLANPVPPSIVPDVKMQDLKYRGNNELLRVTFEINPLSDIKQTAIEVQEYQGETGYSKVIAFSTAHRLVVTDIGSRLQKIAEIIGEVVAPPDKLELEFKAFQLVHIAAADAEEILKQQLNAQQTVKNVSFGGGGDSSRTDRRAMIMQMMASRGRGGPGGRGGGRTRGGSPFGGGSTRGGTTSRTTGDASVRVNSDDRTNSVLVLAPLAKVNLAEKIVKSIDVPLRDGTVERRRSAPYFKVYRVSRVDATEVTKTLTALLPEGAVINEDGRNKTIHILGNDELHAMAAELIGKMDGTDGGSMALELVSVGNLDSVLVANTLKQLYVNDGDAAPQIQPDPQGRQLWVRGSPTQLTSIKGVVTKLQENNQKQFTSQSLGNGIQAYSIQGDPNQFLKTLKAMYDGLNTGTTINVVPIVEQSPIRERVNTSGQRISPGFRPEVDRNRDIRPKSPDRRTTTDRPAGPGNRTSSYRRALNAGDLLALHTPDADRSITPGSLPAKTVRTAAKDEKSDGKSETSAQQSNGNGKPGVMVTVQNGQLLVVTQDKEAQKKLHELVNLIQNTIPNKPSWSVFYLQAAECTEVASMLGQFFPTSTVTETTQDTSLMGGFTRGMRSFGSSLADMSGASSLSTINELKIIPDVRANALFVSGSYSKVQDVKKVLQVLDATDIPNGARDRLPRMIPVRYANVNDVANNIREVFKEELQPSRGSSGSQPNPLAMLMQGGRGGRGSRGGSSRGGGSRQAPQVKLTLGVDERTGHILVSCDDQLFQQVDQFVYDLDKTAYQAKPTTRVIQLDHASSSVVAQTLSAMYPNVSVTVTGGTSNRSNNNNNNNSRQPGTTNGSDRGGDDASRAARRMMFMQMMQGRQGGGDSGGGSPFGGGRSGFGRGGGSSPFGRGGSTGFGRGSFGRGSGGFGGRGGRGRR